MKMISKDGGVQSVATVPTNIPEEDESLLGLKESIPLDDPTKSSKSAYFSSETAVVYPGTSVAVHYNVDDDGLMEDKVAKKIKNDEAMKKYHSSVMKPDLTANKKRDLFFVWVCLFFFVFIGLFVYGFVSGLFLPSKGNDTIPIEPEISDAERQAYMEDLKEFHQLDLFEPASPQEQAMKWLSFQDVPLNVPTVDQEDATAVYEQIRLEQRYALTVWYFAQGGPKLWSTINRDVAAGWMLFGAGVHECEWHGIDCETLPGMELLLEQEARVVVGVRLNSAMGVVLTGTSLSTELGMLSNVRRLDFSDQRLEGSIPEEWKQMTNLEMLALSKNNIQTSIPDWIGKSWPNLNRLLINDNLVEGTLPSSLLTMTNLRHLELQTNQILGGSFDEIMHAIPTLEYLDISSTNLEGTIPSETTMSELRVLKAWNTKKLSGSIPTEIGGWTMLELFSLDDIPELTGTLVTEFGLLTNLETLQIMHAPINGPLPTELGGLTALKTMGLSFLELESTLPVEYANIATLERMDFNINYGLVGTIPTEYGNLVNLKHFDVRATGLTGDVSNEICELEIDVLWAACRVNNANQDALVCVCCEDC